MFGLSPSVTYKDKSTWGIKPPLSNPENACELLRGVGVGWGLYHIYWRGNFFHGENDRIKVKLRYNKSCK